MSWFKSLVVVALFLCSVRGLLSDGHRNGNRRAHPALPRVSIPFNGPPTSPNGTELPSYDTVYYFDQLIDHTNPNLGTFQQRYWFSSEFYEPGGPIILMTPGEVNADGYEGYLTNATINGQIAQQQHGAAVLVEHRFFGYSNPLPDLTVNSLRLLTIEQAVQDLVYFARTVDLPMTGGNEVAPGQAPWVLVGGSYSGALTAWTMVNQPDVFYAGYASSAVVEAILDYWAYFEPIREYMPQNCSADVEAVVAYFDETFSGTNETAINDLKHLFGLNLTHLDDAAGALRNNLWDWQSLQPASGPDQQFFQFCDALEVKDGVNAPATGWGLDWALNAWGTYFKDVYYNYLCGDLGVEDCLGTYDANSTMYTSTAINNEERSWEWMVCNQVGYLQDGPPEGKPAVVSRLIQPIYDERQCQYFFPEAFSTPPVPNTGATNAEYEGWYVQVDRLFFANGLRDPWRDATVSAENMTIASTPTQPIYEGDGFHCSDLLTENAVVDATVLAVQQAGLSYMKFWLAEYNTTSFPITPFSVNGWPSSGNTASPAAIAAGSPPNAWFRSFGGS